MNSLLKVHESVARADIFNPLCACGCGERVFSIRARFLRGHNRKHDNNPPHTLEDGSVNPVWTKWYRTRNREQLRIKRRMQSANNPEKERQNRLRASKKESYKVWRRAWAAKRRKERGDFRRQWRRMVVNLLTERDGSVCKICNQVFVDEKDITIDHIIPICCGGTDEAANLRLAHMLCNSKRPKKI